MLPTTNPRATRLIFDGVACVYRDEGGDPMNVTPVAEPPQPLATVRDRVRRTLAASAEFRSLRLERQDDLIRDMVYAGAAAARAIVLRQPGDPALDESVRAANIARGAGTPSAGKLVESVDFPSFVTALIEGTFEAIVDASIRQMQAYTELLRNVAKPVEEFMRDNVVDEHGRDGLAAESGKGDSARRRLAANRQQVLTTMVLMGINRIVVTDGRINAAVTYELKSR
jgi:hypothetical protein